MRIQWVGQACFYITAADGRSLLIDPFQKVIGLERGSFPADVVVFTHRHLDHYDPSAVPSNASITMGPGFHNVGGFQLLGVQAYHDNCEGLLSGEVTLFSVMVDGFRIVHLSDLGEIPKADTLAKLGKPDVLLFPAGEHTTLSLAEVNQVVRQLAPSIAIPMSYHIPGLVMPAASREDVEKMFPNHRRAQRVELIRGQRLAPGTEIRILDAMSYPPVVSA